MQSTTQGRLVAFVSSSHTARRILHLASPRFDVVIEYAAAAALTAAIGAGSNTVLVVEQPSDVGITSRQPGPSCTAVLEAARIRCPAIRRVMLAQPEQMPALIPILHHGLANELVALPIQPAEFLAAILAKSGSASSGQQPAA